MKVQGRRKRGRPKRRWSDKVKDDIKDNGLWLMMCTTMLHGGVCHRTSNQHIIGNKMKEGKKQKKKMKHTVCLMSYLKIRTQSYVCTGVWQLVDAFSNHLYFILPTR